MPPLVSLELIIDTPRWGVPFLAPARYKAAAGGRGSGKSHFFAEMMVERCVADKDLRAVCIREIQKSLKFSSKQLIEDKIKKLGVSHLFEITETEIRRVGGLGIIIFQGMQDHTADSIKSLEGFGLAWVEEAQNLSARSLRLLRPTIRKDGSEIWFSWNPDQKTDAVDALFFGAEPPENAVIARVNYTENPFMPDTLREEMEYDKRVSPETFDHVWLGGYNEKSSAKIMNGKWVLDEFEPEPDWNGPYFGADWGFSQDPTTLVKCWENDGVLYVEYEVYEIGLEISDTPAAFLTVPDSKRYKIRADSARPETISHVRRAGFNIVPAVKGKGSVEDGIAHLRGYKRIVIHPRCQHTAKEARLYSYKVDKLSGEILPDIIDANNHCWDAIRYAVEHLMKRKPRGILDVL